MRPVLLGTTSFPRGGAPTNQIFSPGQANELSEHVVVWQATYLVVCAYLSCKKCLAERFCPALESTSSLDNLETYAWGMFVIESRPKAHR